MVVLMRRPWRPRLSTRDRCGARTGYGTALLGYGFGAGEVQGLGVEVTGAL